MIRAEIEARLIAEWGFQRQETAAGPKLVRGRCPACGQPEAHCYPGNPYVIICPRKNKCGRNTHVKTLYGDLFNQFARRHPNGNGNPRATQDAYLRSRGIDPVATRDWWQPDTTTAPDDRNRAPGAGPGSRYPSVRFTLSNGVHQHRLIDYDGKNKNKTVAPFRSHFWHPPGDFLQLGLERRGELFMSEGILNAVSLLQAGLAAVSNVSSGHVPGTLLELLTGKRVVLVIAQDNDVAGRKSADALARACAERGLSHRFAFPPEGEDWNDLLLSGALAPGRLERTLELADWRGRLHRAPTAKDFWEEWVKGSPAPMFVFRGETYVARKIKGEEMMSVGRIADFTAERIYRLRLEPIADRPEYSEVVRVRREGEEPHEVVLAPAALANNSEFRKAMFSQASAQWDGILPDLNVLLHHIRSSAVPTVRQVEVWGYDRRADSYFFPDAAYGPDGKRIEPGENGIVDIRNSHRGPRPAPGAQNSFKLPRLQEDEIFFWTSPYPKFRTPNHQPPTPNPELDVAAAIAHLEAAGPHGFGLSGLGFFTAALFAHQVAGLLGMFPFLSLYGETHTGKSTLLKLLHRLLGREWEGMPVNEANTKVGQARYVGAYSNMPVALIEGDAHANVSVESVMNLRHAYNRGAIRVTGVKSGDNTVRATPFRGALVFGWNEEKLEDAKVKERMVSLRFAQADNSQAKLESLVALENIPPPAMARFFDMILTDREAVLAHILEMLPVHEAAFAEHGVAITRTAQNHAVPLAGFSAVLRSLLPKAPEAECKRLMKVAFTGLLEAALRKERELGDDPDDLQLFFDRIGQWLNDGRAPDYKPTLANYSGNEGEIAVNMVQVEDKCASHHVHFNKTAILKALRRSQHFIRGNHPYPREDGTQVKCWAFKAAAFQ